MKVQLTMQMRMAAHRVRPMKVMQLRVPECLKKKKKERHDEQECRNEAEKLGLSLTVCSSYL